MLTTRQRELEHRAAEISREADEAREKGRSEAWSELQGQREMLRNERMTLEKDRARFAEHRETYADELLRARVLAEKLRTNESLRLEAAGQAHGRVKVLQAPVIGEQAVIVGRLLLLN